MVCIPTQGVVAMIWVLKMMHRDPERLLSLLMRARAIDRRDASLSRSFRAGLRIGRRYPDIADSVLQSPPPEWNI